MSEPDKSSVHERWGRLRFSVVGQLLAAPPEKGALRAALRELAQRTWRHPRRTPRDPVGVLRRKVRKDLGSHQSVSAAVQLALREQYDRHTSWSVYLHYLNIKALTEMRPDIGEAPCYSSVRRFLMATPHRSRATGSLSVWISESSLGQCQDPTRIVRVGEM